MGRQGKIELQTIWSLARAGGYEGRVAVDLSVVRGLEYYTGPVFEAELTFQVSGFVGAEDWTTPPTCATEATEGTHVGAEPIVCTGGDAGTNYAVLRVAGTLTIAKATLAVDAISATKTYGDPDPAFAWGYSGFVAGDETANTGITGAAACARIVADTAVGTLQIGRAHV